MIIITYSETNAETIEQSLGKAEYSYYFIYKKYLPAMEQLGQLIAVRDPLTEVDRIYHEHPDEDCIFLSFSPPHRTVLNLQCPTVCVFAWEFSTIPQEHWHDKPEFNWAQVLQDIGNALTISQFAADVVNKAVPEGLNLVVIPAAVDTVDGTKLKPKKQSANIEVKATLYESRAYDLAADMVNDEVKGIRDPLQMTPWDGEPIHLAFTESNLDTIELLIGFYSAEDWGTWSRTAAPWIMLPHTVTGAVIVELELVAYGTNVDREIEVQLGEESATITPSGMPATYSLEFNPGKPVDLLKFTNLDLTHAPGARDHRSLGIGMKSLSLRRPENYKEATGNFLVAGAKRIAGFLSNALNRQPQLEGNLLDLSGIVYTTVMNPQDGRKNWEDMVTAFCWAFRDEENATLVLKMTHNNLATFLGKLLLLYSQMSPFKCRVVAVHGFLTEEQYSALIDATHYVVNSSHCEGQCLPLMEFMGQGIPAIAPDHTAMADYINHDNAFVIDSSLYPTFWPFDDHRKAMRTMCYRIDWNSMKDAYLQSFAVAMHEPQRYEAMRLASIDAIERTAGQTVVYDTMKKFIARTATRASNEAGSATTS
ncbi:MAG: hypothetical protein NXI15_06510 [Gammaproteobacteria bacterium]|nr:hypothetical protein [Gammaproteobacteria bacterium]